MLYINACYTIKGFFFMTFTEYNQDKFVFGRGKCFFKLLKSKFGNILCSQSCLYVSQSYNTLGGILIIAIGTTRFSCTDKTHTTTSHANVPPLFVLLVCLVFNSYNTRIIYRGSSSRGPIHITTNKLGDLDRQFRSLNNQYCIAI